MGYAWNGVCHADTASALDAFAASVPALSGNAITSFSSAPFISGSGLVTWSVISNPLTSADPVTVAGTTQLLNCNEGVDQWPVQSLLLPIALFFAAFAGFKSGYRP